MCARTRIWVIRLGKSLMVRLICSQRIHRLTRVVARCILQLGPELLCY